MDLTQSPPGAEPATPGGAIAATEGAAVRFEGVTKRFGSVTVLDDISFEVPRSQRLAIIGPSGSGKTSILRCLMTLEPFQAGAIVVDGTRVTPTSFDRRIGRRQDVSLVQARRKVGMVFQQFNLFPHMRIVDNVAAAPHHVLGVPWPEARAQALGYLESVGVAEKAQAFPHQLSGGQQQRAAIARTLAMKPSIVLLDEITSALDPELVGEVLRVVKRLADESRTTLLIVTHEMHFAEEVADRVMFIDHGQIVEDGPPASVLRSPQNERTRQFLRALSEYR
jgi:polar amino acid transport system ATP-binding protein